MTKQEWDALDDYYFDIWLNHPDTVRGKTEKELEDLILSQVNNKEKKFENFVLFAYLMVITQKPIEYYNVSKKFHDLYWDLVIFDYYGYRNYWEYEDYAAFSY